MRDKKDDVEELTISDAWLRVRSTAKSHCGAEVDLLDAHFAELPKSEGVEEKEMTQDDLVELLHLARLTGSFFTLRSIQLQNGLNDPDAEVRHNEVQARLVGKMDELRFDTSWVLGAMQKRALEERDAQRARKVNGGN